MLSDYCVIILQHLLFWSAARAGTPVEQVTNQRTTTMAPAHTLALACAAVVLGHAAAGYGDDDGGGGYGGGNPGGCVSGEYYNAKGACDWSQGCLRGQATGAARLVRRKDYACAARR